jgi:hypothetical protein
MVRRNVLMAAAIIAGLAGSARAVVMANFEDNTVDGFGNLTNSTGVQPFASPTAGAVVTPGSGPMAGAKVLEVTGNASFNFGYSQSAAIGFDFLGAGLRSAFLTNNKIEFDWEGVPNGGSGGFLQLYNIILNSQGGGFTNVAGQSMGTPETNQFYFTGYTGALHHVSIDYTNYKNTVLASANPDGGGWLQFAIQPNAGGGAPADIYFDNFQLTPEPASLGVMAVGAVGMLRRRRSN